MSVLVFDIETIPDLEAGRRLYGLEGLDDADTARAMFHLRRNETGSDFLPHHLHRVVAISCVLANNRESVKVWSLGEAEASEAEIVKRFFDGLDRFTPDLVSWNGSGFDLPVLHYRALRHGISAPRYWETGDSDQSFRWNNYLSRFHSRHLDLMDVLAGYQARANAPLDEIAALCGFPGKMGMSGGKVWQAIQAGDFGQVRDYCETDVLNTYLVFLRFQLLRGHLSAEDYARECRLVRETLTQDGRPHFTQFLDAWPVGALERPASDNDQES
jgi:predicted PolB exonuclease-like 3'-5' exonuclease